jgi:hypothetical protein
VISSLQAISEGAGFVYSGVGADIDKTAIRWLTGD